ncbi:MAG: cyclodeaminase/cyclohydrolase family protein [Pseudomonadales bacterium]|nr:cyclodeaminase/cyclohydrolase family protein [Pseudomonadales bacterium]
MIEKGTLGDYLSTLASKKSTPGGGAVAGVCGAQAAALIAMVGRLTRGNPAGLETAIDSAIDAQQRFLDLADNDMQCFEEVMSAWRLPADSDDEKARRQAALQTALKAAASVPLDMIRLTGELLPSLALLVESGNRNLITDVGIAAHLCESVLQSSRLNVLINLKSIEDSQFIADSHRQLETIEEQVEAITAINKNVETILTEE